MADLESCRFSMGVPHGHFGHWFYFITEQYFTAPIPPLAYRAFCAARLMGGSWLMLLR